jgi:hypothetical protein
MDKFDPANKDHVNWLKKLSEVNTQDKFKLLNKNPMNHQFSEIEMVQTLFGLCAIYTKAIFKNKAFIPPPPQEDENAD